MIQFKKGYKYQLFKMYKIKTDIKPVKNVKTHFLSLNTDGLLIIKRGYSWDGASGGAIDTKNFMRASLVHDCLYQLITMRKIKRSCRKQADLLLQAICREDKMSKFRAWYVYRAVRRFGGLFSKKEKKVYTAP